MPEIIFKMKMVCVMKIMVNTVRNRVADLFVRAIYIVDIIWKNTLVFFSTQYVFVCLVRRSSFRLCGILFDPSI